VAFRGVAVSLGEQCFSLPYFTLLYFIVLYSTKLLCTVCTFQHQKDLVESKSRKPPQNFWIRLVSSYQINAQFLYSITIYMLHYKPQHVSSSTLLIFRRTDRIITASGSITLCKRSYSVPVESGLQPALNRHTVRPFKRVTIPDAVIIQFVLLKMSKVLLETCWGL